MKATQVSIAKAIGVDVSTVNKILNRFPGAVFREATIRRVLREAKRQGFQFDRKSKGRYLQLLVETRTALAALMDEVAEIHHDQASRALVHAFARGRKVLAEVPPA